MKNYDLIIIGGGPAGMAAAISAYENGITNLLLIERNEFLGGILNQCIHNGFGLHTFKEELTGPEYSERYISIINKYNIPVKLETTVIKLTNNKALTYINEKEGMVETSAKAIILAMGCKERSRGAIRIPGERPSGIYTAGTAQNFVNLHGFLPGKKVIILGSGDIGLIMARRLTLEGAKVISIVEIQSYSNGLQRNIVQCLQDFNIPLLLSHTVIDIKGKDRVEGVTIAEVDSKYNPIIGTEKYISCDTLLLSVGLIPENSLTEKAGGELSKITSGCIVDESLESNVEGIFSCGNVLHVHDIVDFVSEEGKLAGLSASKYIKGILSNSLSSITINFAEGISYVLPMKLSLNRLDDYLILRFRVNENLKKVKIVLQNNNKIVFSANKKAVHPAEMESIKIKKSLLLDEEGLKTLTLSILKE